MPGRAVRAAPVGHLARLFTAGDPAPVDGVLREPAAMRSSLRDINLGREPDPAIPRRGPGPAPARTEPWHPCAWQVQSLLLACPDEEFPERLSLARRAAPALPDRVRALAVFVLRQTNSPWFRPAFAVQPRPELLSGVPLLFQLHVLSALLAFAASPFTRLVHMLTAPLGCLTRPYIVHRGREPRPGRGWERIG
ncbi:respiratory nitrate reductase subunit gamma [Streptomyces sp. NPDC020792]|uniref:respiratory nitrate reductase subunit gamma n=1 Tax=Streptomyces sp. NPDC020792 TaxID=3365089 RepID=UPI00379DAAE6